MDEIKEIKNHLSRLYAKLFASTPYIAIILKKLWIYNVPTLDAPAATDGKHLYINWDLFKKFPYKQQLGILMHESLHVVLGHLRRSEYLMKHRVPQEIINIAADALVNNIIFLENFELPQGVITPQFVSELLGCSVQKVTKMNMEEIAFKLAKKINNLQSLAQMFQSGQLDKHDFVKNSNQSSNDNQKQKSSNKSQGSQNSSNTKSATNKNFKGFGSNFSNGLNNNSNNLSNSKSNSKQKSQTNSNTSSSGTSSNKRNEQNSSFSDLQYSDVQLIQEGDSRFKEAKDSRELEKLGREIVREAIVAQKLTGKGTSNAITRLEELTKPQINWRTVLKSAVRTWYQGKVRKSWSRLNKKVPYKAPSNYYVTMPDVWFLIDTSGSIGQKELRQFISEVIGVLRIAKPKIHLVFWDTEVKEHLIITKVQDIKNIKIVGGGGTDPESTFRFVASKLRGTELVILVSDFVWSNVQRNVQLWNNRIFPRSFTVLVSSIDFIPELRAKYKFKLNI